MATENRIAYAFAIKDVRSNAHDKGYAVDVVVPTFEGISCDRDPRAGKLVVSGYVRITTTLSSRCAVTRFRGIIPSARAKRESRYANCQRTTLELGNGSRGSSFTAPQTVGSRR